MDNESAEVIAAKPTAIDGDEDRRVEELLRVNARLAAELRSLSLGRAESPRPGSMTAARRLAVLTEERDALATLLSETQTAVEHGRVHREELERVNAELNDVVQNLRAGPRGLPRRLFARLHRYFRQ